MPYHAASCGDDDDDDHVNPGSAAAATTDSTTLLSVRHFTLPCFGTNRHGYYLVYIIPFPIPISMEVSGGIIWSLYGWVRRGRNDPTFTAVPMRSSFTQLQPLVAGGTVTQPRLFLAENLDDCQAGRQDWTYDNGPLLPPGRNEWSQLSPP